VVTFWLISTSVILLPLDVIDNPSLPLVETLKSFGEASSLVINWQKSVAYWYGPNLAKPK
jgi:hypothetical protein